MTSLLRPLPLALLALLLLTACAEVDRTVTGREINTETEGDPFRAVIWESNRYARLELRADDDCWDAAVIGQPPPEVCLTTRVLGIESDPYRWSRVITVASALAVIGGLFWFSNRRIGWQPSVASATASDPAPRAFNPADAVTLMRGVATEKQSQRIATRARRDLGRPAFSGLLLAAAILIPLVALLGYGMALGWGAVTGVVLILGVGAAFIVYLVPLPPSPADHEAYIARLLFFGGIAGGLLLAAAIGLVQRTPLESLHGIALLG